MLWNISVSCTSDNQYQLSEGNRPRSLNICVINPHRDIWLTSTPPDGGRTVGLKCSWGVLQCLHPALPWFPGLSDWFPVLPQHKCPQTEHIRMESSSPALFQTAASVSSGIELSPCNEQKR